MNFFLYFFLPAVVGGIIGSLIVDYFFYR